MLSIYPACFFKEENAYSVIFPNLNCATCGDTLEEAMKMAVDCLAGYLHMLQINNEAIPSPVSLDSIDIEEIAKELEIDPCERFVNMVSVDVEAYAKQHFNKAVKKTLTIPAWLNNAALEQNINFSQVLQEALITKVRAK